MSAIGGTVSTGIGGSHVATTSVRFDFAVVGASLWFVGGLLVDGWAHNNLDLSKEGFFTPFHALFYSGFAAVAAVIGFGVVRNRRGPFSMKSIVRALPYGYGVTLAGLAIFATGGVLDMLWHIFFGVEQDVEALFSPTHLMLAVGIGAILAGPIRAGAARASRRSWRAQAPALVALMLLATLVTFLYMWAFGTASGKGGNPHLLYPALSGDALGELRDYKIQHGISAVVLRSLVMVGFVTWAARRFALPRGAAALLIFVPSVLVGTMLDPNGAWIALQACAALASGLTSEFIIARQRTPRVSPSGVRALGVAIPFAFWAVYMSIAAIIYAGTWWTPHVAYGAPVIGAIAGLLFVLAIDPASPESG